MPALEKPPKTKSIRPGTAQGGPSTDIARQNDVKVYLGGDQEILGS